jgi:hypothetical protein
VAPAAPAAVTALPVGSTLGLKARQTGGTLADVNTAQRLYVPTGTRVEFQAVARNTAQLVNFSTATWGGTAAAASTGATCSILFNTRSAADSDIAAATVQLTFGAQNVTVRVIVFDLAADVRPVENFGGRSLTDFGVDERVNLDFTTVPAGIAAASMGGLRWTIAAPIVAGRAVSGLMQTGPTNSGAPPSNGKGYFIAPYLTDNAHNPPTAATKAVRLRLAISGGPIAGAGIDVNFTVHMPIAHMRKYPNTDKHVQNRPSSGFFGDIYLYPANVSFRTIRWREGGGRAVATGAFSHWNDIPHKVTNKKVGGNETLTDMEVLQGNSATGSQVAQADDVFSGALTYTAPAVVNPGTVIGRFEWPIYWQYIPQDLRGSGGGQATWIRFQIAKHVATVYQDGRMEIYKGHAPAACTICATNLTSKDQADPNERHP